MRVPKPMHARSGLRSLLGRRYEFLDYIEGQGQVLGYYTNELHHRGYAKATCYLPHDGANANAITGLRYADHLKDAEFQVEIKPNMGAGAAAMRIEAVRRICPAHEYSPGAFSLTAPALSQLSASH